MNLIKDARHLYTAERQAYHLERPGFRINELVRSPTQEVRWLFRDNVEDTLCVIERRFRVFLHQPKKEVQLDPGAYGYAPLI